MASNTNPFHTRALHALGRLGWARAAIGAAIGIALSGLATWALLSSQHAHALPFLVAPLGASAVLVFCVPASPLAQPWPVIGGNLLSAAIGISIGNVVGDPWLGGSIAVGVAIAAMSIARCLHPPGGACALLCALGAGPLGYETWEATLLLPIAANVLVLAGFAWFYNTKTGHPWPHVAPPAPSQAPEISTREHVIAVLEDWQETLDVDVDDLEAFVQAVLHRKEQHNAKVPPSGQKGGTP